MKRKNWNRWIFAMSFLMIAGLAFGQNKSDFEKASRESGCDMIPYYGLMRDCHRSYAEQRTWCTGSNERGCDSLSTSDKDEARSRMQNADNCLKYRKEVLGIFDQALDKLWRENQQDIKPFVDIITKKIVESQRTHRVAAEETEKRRDKCAALLK